MDITLQKGMLTEIRCIEKFIELGYFCSVPYGDSCKYDVIVDIDNVLYRIQCKSSTWAKDTVEDIKTAGYKVTMEEVDNDKDYQIIIKVQK